MANGLMKSYVQIKIGPVGISITEMQRDFDNLMAAKRAELVRAGVSDPSPSALRKAISREELAHYCRRKTRGSSDTINLIEALVLAVSPATDSLGGRLLMTKCRRSADATTSGTTRPLPAVMPLPTSPQIPGGYLAGTRLDSWQRHLWSLWGLLCQLSREHQGSLQCPR